MASNRNRKLVLQIVGDLDDAKRSLRGLDRNVQGLTNVLGGLAAVISVREIVDFAFGAAEAASNLQALEATTERLVPNLSNVIDEMVETNRQFGLSRQSSRENINAFLSLGDAVGFSEGQLIDLSGQLNTLVLDIAAARDANPEQVFSAFNSALVGNTETLRQFVPTVSAANIEIAALEATGKASAKELTAADKALGLLNLTAQDTEAFVGAAAEEQDYFATQVAVARASIEDTRAEIGERFIPIFADLLQRFNEFDSSELVDAIGDVGEEIGDTITGIFDLIDALAELGGAATGGDSVFDRITEEIAAIGEVIGIPIQFATGLLQLFTDMDAAVLNLETSVGRAINLIIDLINLLPGINIPDLSLPTGPPISRADVIYPGQTVPGYVPPSQVPQYTPPAPSTYSEYNVTVTGIVGDPYETGREIARAVDAYAPGTVKVD